MYLEIRSLVLLALATWRISYMLVEEKGPGQVFATLRRKLGVTYDAFSNRVGSNPVAELFICVYCMSVWVAYGLYAAYHWKRGLVRYLITPLALSTLAILLHKKAKVM